MMRAQTTFQTQKTGQIESLEKFSSGTSEDSSNVACEPGAINSLDDLVQAFTMSADNQNAGNMVSINGLDYTIPDTVLKKMIKKLTSPNSSENQKTSQPGRRFSSSTQGLMQARQVDFESNSVSSAKMSMVTANFGSNNFGTIKQTKGFQSVGSQTDQIQPDTQDRKAKTFLNSSATDTQVIESSKDIQTPIEMKTSQKSKSSNPIPTT